MNSAFDPFGASGAVQGYLYDQWATLYQNYRVHGFYYKVMPTFGSTGISATSVRELIITPSLSSAAFATPRESIEQPRSRSMRWQANSGRAPTMKGYMGMAPLFGIPKKTYNQESSTAAVTTSNPASLAFLHISTYDPVGSADVTTNCGIWITQYVEFFQRAIPSPS